jgi:glycerophosphoryl diester phosphodiesterase
MKRLALILLLSATIQGCVSSSNKLEENTENTLLFGHRGSGGGVVDGLIENTIPSVKKALKHADGVEVDVQMSSSNTIWLFHDDVFNHLCPESQELVERGGYSCILNTPDSVIKKLSVCRGGVQDRIYRLEEFLEVLSNHKNKMASLDIKGYFNSKCVKTNNVSIEYQEKLASVLYELIKKYDIKKQIIAETNYTKVLEELKDLDSSIECHYMSYSDLSKKIDRAIDIKADGITINILDSALNLSNFNKINDNNLKIQLWTIHDHNTAQKALKYAPYSIQVGNINLLKELSKAETSLGERKSQLFH